MKMHNNSNLAMLYLSTVKGYSLDTCMLCCVSILMNELNDMCKSPSMKKVFELSILN